MRTVANSGRHDGSRFQQILACFLAQPGLPFSSVLSTERVERIFAKHGNLFGMDAIYSTVVTLWAFLGQVLRDGKEASCQSAVAEIVVHQSVAGLAVPTSDTGDYCRARAKLSEAALHDLSNEVAGEMEDQAQAAWLWKDRHAKLIDGFTFTMPDTPANQAEYPHMSQQKPGVGLPIARACAILSLATACATNLAIGPCVGKETGESALLREILDSLQPGDIAVVDRFFCSFLMIALMQSRQHDVCARMHHRRHVDFRRGRRLGKYDHLIEWTKPARPDWMDEATYAAIPDKMVMREIQFNVVEPGRRTRKLTIATTLIDPETYTKEDIAQLYGFRWNSELDIRAIKQSLGLDHVRCKSPEMVRRELWTTLLGYNLVRTTAAAAALLHDKQPRQISFTSTCQYILASWALLSSGLIQTQNVLMHCKLLLLQISQCEVAHRPGRIEPRVLKRRRHRYPLMQQPRSVLKAKLENRN